MSKLSAMVRSTLWMNARPMIEVFRQLVASGDAERVVSARHVEVAARQDIAQRMLGDFVASPHRMSPHLWLPLLEHWQGNDFVSHARMKRGRITRDCAWVARPAGAPWRRRCAQSGTCSARERISRGHSLSPSMFRMALTRSRRTG